MCSKQQPNVALKEVSLPELKPAQPKKGYIYEVIDN